MNTRTVASMGLGLLLVLSACSGIPPKQRMAERLEQYHDAAGAAVESFHFWSFYSWEPLGESELAVWTKFNEAYLLTVSQPCTGLSFANAIGISSSVSSVYARFDSVRFERQWCRIREIRPIDVKALRAARQEQIKPLASEPRPAG